MKTKVIEQKFKGSNIFSVWEVDDNDEKVGERPIVSLGVKKLKALAKHTDELIEFIDNN